MTLVYLHWKDLRTHDNTVLNAVDEDILPVFVMDPGLTAWTGTRQREFLMKGLRDLDRTYQEQGGHLVFRRGGLKSQLSQILDKTGAEGVVANNHFGPVFTQAARKLKRSSIDFQVYQDRTAKDLQPLDSNYKSFSQFFRDWEQEEAPKPRDPEELNLSSGQIEPGSIPDSEESFSAEPGEEAGLKRWTEFKQKRIKRYKQERDSVANPDGVSKMSVYLNNGMVGPRRILYDTNQLLKTAEGKEESNIAKYRYELGWREFFQHVKLNNPDVIWNNYRKLDNPVEWRNDLEDFVKWAQGKTGVPFVDAGMRQMLRTGYMHNRLRQNVASFLTKHLLVDWRWGESLFREKLIDYDAASNNGGWQWTSSTGTDTVPNRIFNPVKQGRKYDPQAKYIKRHVEDLRSLEPEKIHSWTEMSEEERQRLEVDYPDPMVDLDKAFHRAKKVFGRALGRQ